MSPQVAAVRERLADRRDRLASAAEASGEEGLVDLLRRVDSALGRLDVAWSPPPTVTGFYLVDSLLAGDPGLFAACAKQIALPAITLGLFVMAPLMRMTRAAMLGVLSSDFIRTARASGLPRRKLLYTYALRNALLPVVAHQLGSGQVQQFPL